MKSLAIFMVTLFCINANATTFLACVGDANTEIKTSDKNPFNTSLNSVRFQIELENFEGTGNAKVTGGLSTTPLKTCTFTSDWVECNENFFMSSKLGEVTKLGVTQQSTSNYKYETKLKVNRKTGLGEFVTTNETITTEPIEKSGTYYTYQSAKFICKLATKNQF